jgi:hypothetical protein
MPAFNIKSLLVIGAFLTFFSCEEVVDLPYDDEPQIEIRSDLSENGLIAQVLLAQSPTDNQPITYIDYAIVKVFKGKDFLEQLEMKLDTKGKPCYKTKSLVPEYDVQYTLRVEVENFKSITATTSVPRPVLIDGSQFVPNFSPGDASNLSTIDFQISFGINDPIASTNFYHLTFYQQLYDFELDSNGEKIPLQHTLKYADLQIKEVDESGPAIKYGKSDFLFDDVLFNGQNQQLAFEGKFRYDQSKKIPGKFFLELRTVSDEYYRSFISEHDQRQNSKDPIVKGDAVFDNTINGVGTFTGFTVQVDTFKVQGG